MEPIALQLILSAKVHGLHNYSVHMHANLAVHASKQDMTVHVHVHVPCMYNFGREFSGWLANLYFFAS